MGKGHSSAQMHTQTIDVSRRRCIKMNDTTHKLVIRKRRELMRSVLGIQFSTLWRSQKNHILDQVYLELARLKYSR